MGSPLLPKRYLQDQVIFQQKPYWYTLGEARCETLKMPFSRLCDSSRYGCLSNLNPPYLRDSHKPETR